MKIDFTDMKILAHLSTDARMPYSQISKKVNLSSESIKKRVEKLIEDNTLKSFKINLDYSKLGYMEYDIYLKLRNYTQKDLDKIIRYLADSRIVTWIGTCFGKYDLRISVIVPSIEHINDFIAKFENDFPNLYVDSNILYILNKYKISQKKILSNLFNMKTSNLDFMKDLNIKDSINYSSKSKKELISLSDIDKRILSSLNENPRASLVELSKNLGLTPEAIKYRISHLKSQGIIKSFSLIINGNNFNKLWAVFLFKLKNSKSNDFLNYIKSSPNVSSFVNIMGEWNYSVSVFSNNVAEIHKVLMDFRNKFPDFIKDYELLLLFETYKYPIIPSIIFE